MWDASAQPCLTPICTWKPLKVSPLRVTQAFVTSWNSRKTETKWWEQSNLQSIWYSRGWFTVSNSFVRSTNARCRSQCCYPHFSCRNLAANIMRIVLLPLRKPDWDSSTVPSPRGCFWGFAPQIKLQAPQNWNMKHYKSVGFLSIFRVSAPPRRNAKPPYRKLSGDGSVPA